MKITEAGKKATPFKQIATGQVFKAGQEYYMKIVTAPGEVNVINAVNLNYGKMAIFSAEAETTTVEAELIVSESR